MKLKYFKNTAEEGIYELSIRGVIGEDVNGDDIAAEIEFLNTINAKVIKERINSVGGGIINGMSVFDANLESKAEIWTYGGGMAASMANVLLVSGTPGKRFCYEHSMGLAHNPLSDGVSLNDIENEEERATMQIFKDSILAAYSNNTKMTLKQASLVMDAGRLLNSARMLELGMVDEILPSKIKAPKIENLTMLEYMNVCEDLEKNTLITNTLQMKDVTNRLKLQEGASEVQHVQAIEAIENRATLAEENVTSLKADNKSKDEDITALKSEVDKYKNEAVVAAVNSAIDAGKFDKEKKEDLTTMANSMGVENFNKMVELQKVTPVNVVDLLDKGGDSTPVLKGDDKLAAEFLELSKNETEMFKFKALHPENFEKMLNAYNESDL